MTATQPNVLACLLAARDGAILKPGLEHIIRHFVLLAVWGVSPTSTWQGFSRDSRTSINSLPAIPSPLTPTLHVSMLSWSFSWFLVLLGSFLVEEPGFARNASG